MFKLFFIACLFVCVFGTTRIYPTFPSCAYHLGVSGGTDYDGDYYGMRLGGGVVIAKNISADGSYDLLRCDIKNDYGDCYVTFYRKNDQDNPCEHGWVSAYDIFYFYLPYDTSETSRFYYNETKYPQPVKCVNGTDGCQKYCDDTDTECVIVDANGFFVQRNGVNFALYDSSFNLDVFRDDQCNDPQYSAQPHNLCETVKTITPVIPECSYHVKVDDSYGTEEYYGVDINLGYRQTLYAKYIVGEDYALSRCDFGEGRCYVKNVQHGQCMESGYAPTPNWHNYDFTYDSASYPRDVKCPDTSSGCKLYCLDSTEKGCVTLDYVGHAVSYDGKNWTYYPDPPMTVFEDDTCGDPKQHLPAPVDICTTKKLFKPKYAEGCTFRMAVDFYDRRREIRHMDMSGIIVDDKLVALKVISGMYVATIRLDILNDQGEYLLNERSPDDCYEEYEDDEDYIMEYLPEPFWYDSSNYPVATKCPDGSDGCNKYCITSRECVITDAAGHLVQTSYGNNFTYYPAPSVDEFEVDTCKGVHIPAPTVVCNGGQSSTPNPPEPPKPSTSAPISSASIVKSAFTFVVILIVVALL